MDATEITKVIDGVYKNILENFNPASRQMINTGKAYLKSLHGASAASSLYLDTLMRLSRQAQQSTLSNAGDIGSSLMQITEVFKEIHTQQLNTLKAFYVDFLVPLEANLEKDTRVIQTEQKKFLMCHKQRMESYNKAASTVKKMRKKSKKSNPSAATLDKEIKVMQALEEEGSKLEAFCDKSIKEALTQERRRYGFILERQASLAKHYLAFYSKGNTLLNAKLENWMKVAKTREILPESMQDSLLKRIQGGDEEDCIYCSPRKPGMSNSADDTASISSQLRKTKSMDAGEIINLQSEQAELTVASGAGTMSRAKSELNLMGNGGSSNGGGGMGLGGFRLDIPDGAGNSGTAVRPKSLAVASETTNTGYAKALYAYLSSGENQLSFLEGDIIGLIGDKNKGWQYGENLRTQKTGWFPVAYTEMDVSTPAMEMMKSATMPASGSGGPGSNPLMSNGGASPAPPPMPIAVPLPPSVISMNNMNSQSRMVMTMSGGGHGTYSPTSSSNSSSSTFHQKRLNLADVIVHRTPESMMGSQPTTPSAINSKSLVTSPTSPMGPLPGSAGISGGGGGGSSSSSNNNNNNNLIVPATQSRGQQTNGVAGGRHGAAAHASGSIPSGACASDSLHSSNDSGFSNDNTRVVPPPQPDIDYSDDEPQLSNRRNKMIVVQGDKTPPQTGDKWLMERYHMSESIRIGGLGIGGITRRRSLSFSNVSGVGVHSPVRSSTRGAHDYGQGGNSGYPPYAGRYTNGANNANGGAGGRGGSGGRREIQQQQQQASFIFDNKESGPLKKFLNRTKSLIWKRQGGLDRFESISVAGSTGSLELWGSHTSLIEANYDTFEMKTILSQDLHYDDNDTIKNEDIGDEEEEEEVVEVEEAHNNGNRGESNGGRAPDSSVNRKGKKQQKEQQHGLTNGQTTTKTGAKAIPPPLPPFPANLRGLNGINVKTSAAFLRTTNNTNDKATSTTESLKNLSLSHSPLPTDGDTIDGTSNFGARDNDSCIFISDHMKAKGSMRSDKKSTKSSIITERHSKKIQADLMIDDDDDDEEEEEDEDNAIVEADIHPAKSNGNNNSSSNNNNNNNKGRRNQIVTRVESFSDTEVPIVPVQNGHKKKVVSSISQQQSSSSGKSRGVMNGTTTTSNGVSSSSNSRKTKERNNHTYTEKSHNGKGEIINGDNDATTSISRSFIMEKTQHYNRYNNNNNNNNNNSEEEEEVDVDDYEVDEDVIDFDDDENDTSVYNDPMDNTSSVFMVEAEPEDEEDDDEDARTPVPEHHHHHHHHQQDGPQSLPPIMQHHIPHPSSSRKSHGNNSNKNGHNSSMNGGGAGHLSLDHTLVNNGNKTNSLKISKGYGGSRHSNGNGNSNNNNNMHYEHSSRFAPIVPYNSGNGSTAPVIVGVSGKNHHRSSSPVPPSSVHTKGSSRRSESLQPPHNNHYPHHSVSGGHISSSSNSKGEKASRSKSASGTTTSKMSSNSSSNSRPTTIKGSIRSEIHTVELIATAADKPCSNGHHTHNGSSSHGASSGKKGSKKSKSRGEKPIFDYSSQLHRRLYYPERNSKMDQKSERSGNLCGPWYDLWGTDPSVSCK